MNQNEKMILINVEKFKEILLYSWHLLSKDKQQELISLGIQPLESVTNKWTPSHGRDFAPEK